MKVFKMNDMDHVAAESEKQAKDFYKDLCDYNDEEIEEDFLGLVSLQNEMLIDLDDLTDEDRKTRQKLKAVGDQIYVYQTFKWVLNNDEPKQPYVICSTEY